MIHIRQESSRHAVAMMMTLRERADALAAYVKLPDVDIETDPRMFAILDDGCSDTCHNKPWARKAEECLRGYGLRMRDIVPHVKRFQSVGSSRMRYGHCAVPLCIKLTNPAGPAYVNYIKLFIDSDLLLNHSNSILMYSRESFEMKCLLQFC